ncbi:hypothetical protein XBKB1_4190040 [Xenorhabdus bovienii str. kraussei Becker Underwood]|uniref:Uncharacterized protein n=1 Tax=Xenorhabdus bovienii str. kraussei Becker Underwood TaxID=1398204 RepID=A0A077PN25_XENBV|nr:hypothetical protein XBKB1_4190040 [Xenorhabdus bovienii str. kraussei Becker Underwood]
MSETKNYTVLASEEFNEVTPIH